MMAGFSLRALYTLLASLSLLNVLCAADAVGDLQTKGRAAIDAAIVKSATCTKDKLRVRREWYVFSPLFSAAPSSCRTEH
jgi:tyrosinase